MKLRQALRIVVQMLVGSELRHLFDRRTEDHLAPRFVRPGFDLTVDAFPRSANTWIYYQTQLAYPKARIGHHIHSWQHFLFSRLFGVPSILIMREPDSSVQSLVTKKGGSSALGYLDYWITNGLGSLFANKVYLFDDLTGDGGVAPLISDIDMWIGAEPEAFDAEQVRDLMAERTDHKNSKTPDLRPEKLGAFARFMRCGANRLYAQIEGRWRL